MAVRACRRQRQRASRRLLSLARHRRVQHLADGQRERRLARSARFTMRGGARLLPGVTLDFTVRHTEKAADRDGFGDFRPGACRPWRRPSTIARPSPTACCSPAPICAGTRWTEGSRRRSAPTTTARSRPTPTARSSAAARTPARTTRSPISPPTGSRRRASSSQLSGRIEKEDERFTPEGTFADGRLRERGRMRLHGRMARRLRRPAVPHRQHPPRRQRQLPGLHDLARRRPRSCCASSTCGRMPASARP